MDVPWCELGAEQQRRVLGGDGSWDEGRFPGILGWFRWLETRAYKLHVRVLLARYRSYDLCKSCGGKRLNPTALVYQVGGADLAAWHELEIAEARRKLEAIDARTGQGQLAHHELLTRLGYLERVGLGYLTLGRQSRTLSAGEAQRVTLTAALGTSLHNALFVLDEPTTGLHASDVAPLCDLFDELAQRHNSVLVIEHDPLVIARAHRVVELGPGAGDLGGHIVVDGTPKEVARRSCATARALRGRSTPRARRHRSADSLVLLGAREHNL
jgi:excinuclease ABC subunit A